MTKDTTKISWYLTNGAKDDENENRGRTTTENDHKQFN